ncbi:hypothetical protein, partial [Salmonella sp. s54836]|uniref:hypothetical protein n=1 Tax=Salmonella sp. s54836 TaxID=3159673 RepID=UPI00398077BB
MQKLTVFYHGDEQDKLLTIKYGLIMNEWQSSYRLILQSKLVLPTEDGSEKIFFRLEGLAVVDNVKDEDWNQIKLILVVGAPIIPSVAPTGSSAGSSGGVMELTIKQVK